MALSFVKTGLSLGKNVSPPLVFHYKSLSTSINLSAKSPDQTKTGKWLSYNEKIYEPQSPDEEPRPAVRIF